MSAQDQGQQQNCVVLFSVVQWYPVKIPQTGKNWNFCDVQIIAPGNTKKKRRKKGTTRKNKHTRKTMFMKKEKKIYYYEKEEQRKNRRTKHIPPTRVGKKSQDNMLFHKIFF